METKIFVVNVPSIRDLFDEIKGIFDDAPKNEWKYTTTCGRNDFSYVFDDEANDFTPKHMKVNKPCNGMSPWGVGGKKADENMRFGYGLQVDEPRKQDYCDWDDFLEAREAFDDFVDAGERCVELGLEKKNDAPITKCQAIRKPVGCPPLMNVELLGESQFPWWEMGLKWDF